MKPWIATLLGLLAGSCNGTPAFAADVSMCGSFDNVAEHLLMDFAEYPVAFWNEADGSLRQLFAAQDGSTWTLVAVTSDGNACTMRDGKGVKVTATIPMRGV